MTLVTAHQPYNRGYAEVRQSPIAHLRELQNIDKHRHLLTLRTEASDTFTHRVPPGTEVDLRLAPLVLRGASLKDGTELARFIFARPNPDVDVNHRPRFLIALDDGRRVMAVVDGIRTQVATILHNAEQLPEVH